MKLTTKITQEDIDKAIAENKEKGMVINCCVLFQAGKRLGLNLDAICAYHFRIDYQYYSLCKNGLRIARLSPNSWYSTLNTEVTFDVSEENEGIFIK